VARRVTTRLTGDVLNALAGMTLLPSTVTTPSWLGGCEPPFPADEVLACRNLLVHLPRVAEGIGYSIPPTPRFFSRNALDYDFLHDAPEPRNWIAFLQQLWDDDQQSINALQEWFGYCLLPDTRQQKIMMIVGPKRCGKGTIARVLRRLVGEANVCAPTLASLTTHFGLQPLLGKTLAAISDARLSRRTDIAVVTERLLSISGEDAQTVDRKNLPQVTCRLPVRFLVLTNELPKVDDPSGALVGRLILLQLTNSWYGKEDTALTDKLLAELPGILHWAIEGWQRLRARGHFVQPASARELRRDLEDLASPIGAFLRERCQVGGGFQVAVQELFAGWKNWCDENGRKEAGTVGTFGRDLHAAVPGIKVCQPRMEEGRVRIYEGLRLLPFVPDM
jgi:putative DNA primase/helicase